MFHVEVGVFVFEGNQPEPAIGIVRQQVSQAERFTPLRKYSFNHSMSEDLS